MANIDSAKKRARQANKSRIHNNALRSKFRGYLKKVVKAIETKDKEAALSAYRVAVSVIDKTQSKGLIHKNKAARHKSSLNKHIKAL